MVASRTFDGPAPARPTSSRTEDQAQRLADLVAGLPHPSGDRDHELARPPRAY
jgi:hypothetical protein